MLITLENLDQIRTIFFAIYTAPFRATEKISHCFHQEINVTLMKSKQDNFNITTQGLTPKTNIKPDYIIVAKIHHPNISTKM